MSQLTGGIRLTEWTSCGGCAAKWGAGELASLVGALSRGHEADGLLVGLSSPDDAAVFDAGGPEVWISTTDFFPPLVDDPFEFGGIAAANACSDVFAMGGRVRFALNVAAFPEDLPLDVIAAILEGAATKVVEAGGVIAGGHTVRAPEPLFGLAVQGTVDRASLWLKSGAEPGHRVVLSKGLGTGIAMASGDPFTVRAATDSMLSLNREASLQLNAPGACTDVTGFGLIGHASEVAQRSGVVVCLRASDLPALDGALDAAERGVRTGGDRRNRESFGSSVRIESPLADARIALAFDPQTSGGLLATVSPDEASTLVSFGWHDIGEILEGPPSVQLGA